MPATRLPASSDTAQPCLPSTQSLILLGLLLILGLVHVAAYKTTEPFFLSDETGHVMTGVFFRDLLRDLPVGSLRDYATRYELQYPALALLIWPPFFHVIEGLFMLVFGPSLAVSKLLIGLFTALACAYLFRFARRTHGVATAALAVLIFGLCPLIFAFSRQVMLEMPALALGLGATYHVARYLDQERRRDLLFAALTSALTVLTRYDGLYLLPLFALMLFARRRLDLLRRQAVLVSAGLVLLLVLPFYWLVATEIGWFHVKQATQQISPTYSYFLAPRNFFFYPSLLPQQIGWFAFVPAVVGLVFGMTGAGRGKSWPYLSIVGATYVTFTPLAELESRHAIYWIPAFSLFAAEGVCLISNWLAAWRLRIALITLVVAGTCWGTLRQPALFVRGYGEAARYVLSTSKTSRFVMFDGYLSGNFIFQIRVHDPQRRLWVLRGDKLLFVLLGGDPTIGYKEIAKSDKDILDTIFRYDPELIVVEEPRVPPLPIAERLRAVLRDYPDRFRLESVIPVQSNVIDYRGMKLMVYRNTVRNAHPDRRLEVEMLMLRRSIQTVVP
jgi:hypothetical protein